ncbi:hypothetical protein [Allorhizocola rhizosphaerae]|uniref:hypothetical protein n=1 Tax=Allorhizocola rhizosphaerae TaxID=1872709 RepID=UPI000E3ECF74|nr:hypothetical protein [Allorhizocola rhizosphaerae]
MVLAYEGVIVMAEQAAPSWQLILMVIAVVTLLAVLIFIGVRDWFREAALDRAARQRRESRDRPLPNEDTAG